MFSFKSIFSTPRAQVNQEPSVDEMVDIVIDERLVSKKTEPKSTVLNPWTQGPSTPSEMAKSVIDSSRASFDVDQAIADPAVEKPTVKASPTPAKAKPPRTGTKSQSAKASVAKHAKAKTAGTSTRPKRGLNTVGFPKGDWVLPGSSGAPEISVNFQAEYSGQRPQAAAM